MARWLAVVSMTDDDLPVFGRARGEVPCPETGHNGHSLNGGALVTVRLGDAQAETDRDKDVRGPDTASGGAASRWASELARALLDVQRALGSRTVADRPPLFGDGDAVDLLQRDFPRTPWLVTGLITRGGITTIGAEPKVSKTWLATEIAIAVATGTKVCGEFFAEHGVVAYYYAEDTDKQVRNRVRALLAGRGDARIERGRLHLRPRGRFMDITKDDDLALIIASCRAIGQIDLLVLDPLRDVSSAAEDSSDEISRVMRRLRLIAELLSCTVAIVHHAGKSSVDSAKRRPGQRLRGSGAIHGSTDSGIYLASIPGEPPAKFRIVVDSEVKGARSGGQFTLELAIDDDGNGEAVKAAWAVSRAAAADAGHARDDQDDHAVFSRVRDLAIAGKRLTRRQLRAVCGIPEGRTRHAIERLLAADRLALQDLPEGKGIVCVGAR